MNFRRWVVFTFLIHVLVIVVDKGGGLILYLLTANKRAQHGMSGIVATIPFVVGAIANLGLATAMVYFIRRRRFEPQVCFETSMAVALVWGSFVGLAGALCALYVLPWIDPELTCDPRWVWPTSAAVPLLLVASYANSTQLATERVRDYGLVHLVTSLAFLPAFFACFFAQGGDVEKGHVPLAVAWGRLASTFVVAIVTLLLVRKVVTLRLRVNREFLGAAIRYGWKANLSSTLTYLNHRVDLLVLGAIVVTMELAKGTQESVAKDLAGIQVALYSLSVTWAELVWHFPEAMRDLFFSKVAGSSHEQARQLTPVLARLGFTISVFGALLIVVLVNPIMGTITALARGSDAVWVRDWSPDVSACLWMLVPGTAAFTVSKVLQADLAARDRLQACVNVQLLVLVTMLGFDWWLIPTRGAIGAALASSIAYGVGTVFTLWAYGRETKIPMWRCLIVHGRDFRYIAEILAAVLGKLRRKSS